MYTIHPISEVPAARPSCIAWSDTEWSRDTGYSPLDWEAEFERIEQDPVDEIFVAMQGDMPIGMVWMLEHEDVASHSHLTPWVSCLVVDEEHRDMGVARSLVSHVEAYAAAGGDNRLYLLTESPTYYFTLDWEVLDTAPLGERSVFVMKKPISQQISAE